MKKLMEKLPRLALIIVSLLSMFMLTGSAHATPKSYKDAEHGFSFNYPENWMKADEAIQGPSSVVVYAKPVEKFAANANVIVTAPQNIAQISRADLESAYEVLFSNIEMISFKKEKFQGHTCIIVEYRWTRRGDKIQQKQYLFDVKDKGYSITFTALQSNFANYESAFESIARSFQLPRA